MPVLGQSPTTRLYLPSTNDATNDADRAYVELKNKLTMGDIMSLNETENDTERGMILFAKVIEKWNYFELDENGNPSETMVPITSENIGKLAPEDFIAISEWVNKNITESMKGLDEKEGAAFLSSPDQATASHPPTT